MGLHAKAIWNLLDGQRGRFAAAIAAMVLASCFLYLVPLIPQAVFDGVLAKDPAKASTHIKWMVKQLGGRAWLAENLWFAGFWIIFCSACAGILLVWCRRLAASACETIIKKLRDRIYDHLHHLPSRYYDSAETGDLVQRCTSDVETVRVFLSTQIVEIGRAMVMFLVPLPLMLSTHLGMTLASVCLLPVIVGFSIYYFRKVQKAFKISDEVEAQLTARIQENLTGIRVVRAFSRQAFEEEQFAGINRASRDADFALYQVFAKFWAFSDLWCMLQQGLMVAVGIILICNGALGIGAFYFFFAAVQLFLWPMRMMGRILADLGKALVSLGRIDEILHSPIEVDAPLATASPLPAEVEFPAKVSIQRIGDIEFDGVSFAYGETPVLEKISFSVKAGQTLALVGPSGSGKSTILRLLMRLYEPSSGVIRIGGRNVQEYRRKWVRAQIAAVFQNPFLYSRKIGDNIKIARPEVGNDAIHRAAKKACVHDAIVAFEDGYDTIVGERGVTLSGGQRQRTALARAFLQEAPVLVLDDALSAVDTHTEAQILRTLRSVPNRNQTKVIVAHRLSAVMHADIILVLQQGRIIQSGTHTELSQREGWYRQLWEAQCAIEEDDALAA